MAGTPTSATPPGLNTFDKILWRAAQVDEPLNLAALVAEARAVSNGHGMVIVETVIADGPSPLDHIGPNMPDNYDRTVGPVRAKLIPDKHGPFVISTWPTAHPGVFNLIGGLPSSDPRWHKVTRWIARAAPHVVPCLLDHSDFTDIGAALEEHGDVEVSRMSARRASDMSSLSRGWAARSSTLRPTATDAIATSEREGAAVQTLTIRIADVINMHLRRLAGATFYSGQWDLFERLVMGRLAHGADRRRTLMSNRARRASEALRPPISIRLPRETLNDAEATGELIEELEHISSVALAVLHRNPYLHVVATDYLDGSNFDVMVTSAKSIEVYPGFRASLGALTRLTQRLADRFEAFEIVEAPPLPPANLEDLVQPA